MFRSVSAVASACAEDPVVPGRIQVREGNKPFLLAHTSYVQRIATSRGLGRSAAEGTVGAVREVPDTVDYRFWKEQR
jgi:hypothetical protein